MICFIACLMGCSNMKDERNLNGNWETTTLIKKGVYQQIAISYIEMKATGHGEYAVHGNAGVNVFNGTVKFDGNKYDPGNWAVTKMMGPPAVQEFEDLFLEAMMAGDVFEIKNGELMIRSTEDDMEIRFIRKNRNVK